LSVISAIGNTPLVSLDRSFGKLGHRVYAKLEMLNPGGSSKDRAALNMIEGALKRGELSTGATVVESSSGNMAVGLALVCSVYDLKMIAVVDPNVSRTNLDVIRCYGAEVVQITESEPSQYLAARKNAVDQILKNIPGAFWTDQYSNFENAEAQSKTFQEVVNQLGAAPNYYFCAVGTCGTIRGAADYVRRHGYDTKIIAVDAVGSRIHNSPVDCIRYVPGHGSARRSELWRPDMSDDVEFVTDQDCITGSAELVRNEAIFSGGSAGGVYLAARRFLKHLGSQATAVLLLSDRGERYLDSVHRSGWLESMQPP